MEKIHSFTQLRTWQKSRELAGYTYKLTNSFPESEKFGLVSQMRRCSVSIAANIAEGFSRDSQLDKKRFYNMSLSSVTELLSHSYIARDLGFIKKSELQLVEIRVEELHKMLNSMIKKAPGRNT